MLDDLFAKAQKPSEIGHVRALLVPHAGYVFSGGVAASGYMQLDPETRYDHVFILASSHRVSFGKASIYNQGDYLTPLGTVRVDQELSGRLIKENEVFTFDPSAHNQEHSIEVQLPFLQHHLKKPFTIVPIVLGTHLPETCRKIAEALKPWFNERNLFIISADFSHYPSYEEANRVDQSTARAFCSNSPEQFQKTILANEKLRIPNLATSMCAWPAALTLLYLTQNRPEIEFHEIEYKNSGDISPYGDKSGVVGYYAISVTQQKKPAGESTSFALSINEQEMLLDIAREALESHLQNKTPQGIDPDKITPNLNRKLGAFVTLKSDGKLRGCIGTFEPDQPLHRMVASLAVESATRDNRFLPVQARELKEIHIDISVLTPMRKIDNISEIILGKHGIYIRKGFQSGTFLPQVATDTGWTLEQFLGHCSRDKAGIGWNGWKDGEVFVYEAIVFEEKGKH